MWFIIAFVLLILIAIFVPTKSKNSGDEMILKYSAIEDDYIEPQVFNDVITEDEKKYIIDTAGPMFARSSVVGSDKPSEVRTSETAWIHKDDQVVGPMMKRICDQFGVPFENAESLQVVRYKPGTYYRQHHDSCCDDNESCKGFAQSSGQRIRTILVYLNDDFEGGETDFPTLNKKLKAPPRGAVVFHPMSKSTPEACHPKALHAGLPVTSGEKTICNIWIREKKWA
jgi:prolyl 4-hydroxylase